MGKDSTPPPAPDYVGAAQAQGQSNIQAVQTQAALNRVNTSTPYGDLTYSQSTTDPNQWNANVSLSPDQQQLLDAQTQGQQAKATDANNMLGTVQNATATPFDTSSLTQRQGVPNAPNLSMYGGSTAAPNGSVNTSGVPGLNTDWGDQAKQAQDAAYAKQTAILDPQYQQQEDQLRSQLAASGVTAGSQAYSDALDNFNRNKASDYGNARNSAISEGNNEQATLAGESLTGNNQLYSQALQNAGFGNTAAAQTFNQGLAANQNNNNVAESGFANQATAEGLSDAQRQQEIQEQAYLRELPLNEYNALATGAQVTQPNFNVGTSQVGAPGASPIFAATQAQGGAANDIYNQQTATNNSNTQAGVGAIASVLSAYFL